VTIREKSAGANEAKKSESGKDFHFQKSGTCLLSKKQRAKPKKDNRRFLI